MRKENDVEVNYNIWFFCFLLFIVFFSQRQYFTIECKQAMTKKKHQIVLYSMF